ncbi:hypothetical protein [Haloferula sp. BvORR071]|uniref:hypothetical protein n=1 Tax=Haloferula sp. BvORR071 TaxID=1396141 RepID=UPI000556C53A|nr:hypothetical protein [Haloferula sp. BvORR071]
METVSLGDFISETLQEIARGVRDANDKISADPAKGFEVYSIHKNKGDLKDFPGISFDVGVAAADSSKTKGGFSITLVHFGANAGKESGRETKAEHRIKFTVGIAERIQ